MARPAAPAPDASGISHYSADLRSDHSSVSFPFGILVGLVAAVALFVLEYGRVETIRDVLRGSEYQSNMEGWDERRAVLQRSGDAILILRLQGYLFFGTAERLRQKILEELNDEKGSRVRFVLIDFHRVSGLDLSAALSFIRLVQVAERDGFTVVASGGSEAVRGALRRGGVDGAGELAIRFDQDIERGLAWCENALLKEIAPEIGTTPVRGLEALVRSILRDADEADRLTSYFQRLEFAAGDLLITQGAPSDDIYFIEQGRASVTIEGIGKSPSTSPMSAPAPSSARSPSISAPTTRPRSLPTSPLPRGVSPGPTCAGSKRSCRRSPSGCTRVSPPCWPIA